MVSGLVKFSYFEIGMLVCFGFAWPVDIYKAIKSKTTEGKSLFFMAVILLGYIFGITHKILFSHDIVLVLYIINAVMVSTDISLYIRNSKKKPG